MRDIYTWEQVNGIGELYTEIELIVGVEPVLFVCTTNKTDGERYLIMTYDSYEGIYIMKKINAEDLLDMLENRVTMEQSFRKGRYILKTYIDTNGNMSFKKILSNDFDGGLLPKKGEYFELHSRYILDYIQKLKEKRYCLKLKYNYCFDEDKEEIFTETLSNNSFVNTVTKYKNYTVDTDIQNKIIVTNKPFDPAA